MVSGRKIAAKKEPLPPEEVQRIVRDADYNLDGKPRTVTHTAAEKAAHHVAHQSADDAADHQAERWIGGSLYSPSEHAKHRESPQHPGDVVVRSESLFLNGTRIAKDMANRQLR